MLLCWLSAALAQDVIVTVDQDNAEAAGIDPAQFEQEFSAAIEDELRLGDQSEYLRQMAQAAVLSTKGMGADYATNPQRFVLGGGFGSAVSASGMRFGRGDTTLPQGGFSFQVSALAGLNLGALAKDESPARRFLIYGNGMMLETNNEPFEGSLLNYGGHVQIKLLKKREEGPAEWGGIDFTTGYEVSQYTMRVAQGLPIGTDTAKWDAVGSYTITSSTSSVPLELSTNMRVGPVTLFGGGAYDIWQEGGASSTISLDGGLTTEVQGQTAQLGSARVSYGSAAQLESFPMPRAFVGVQANIFLLKVYGQLNMQLEEGVGGHAGVRVAL